MDSDDDPAMVPTEEYAVLGDGATAVLVSRRGSIDWMCVPTTTRQPVSPGSWARRRMAVGCSRSRRDLRDPSLPGGLVVLETTYETPTGTAVARRRCRSTTAGPTSSGGSSAPDGTVEVEHEWVVRFGYGAVEPWVHHVTDDEGADTSGRRRA